MMKKLLILMLMMLPLRSFASEGDASLFTPYSFEETSLTRAPFGYRPFYISHYGRHGCRYMSERSQVEVVLSVLSEAHARGLLTAEGEALLKDMEAFDAAQDGMYGQLAPRGAQEHRQISSRMYKRFSPAFRRRSRRKVNCISSMLPRCIVSMANFCAELQMRSPSLEVSYLAGPTYYKKLNTPDSTKALIAIRERSKDLLYPRVAEYFDDSAFFGRIFSDPAAARGLRGEWVGFFLKLYDCACDVDCAGMDLDLRRYFSPEEFEGLMHLRNCIIFAEDGRNPLNWEARKPMVRIFLDEILTKADAAVAGNDVAADLRFGHDSGLSGLMSLVGIKGYDMESEPEEAWKVWDASEMMPMASNLQWVFYRSWFRKEILVKILFNEKETSIPALGEGPYYRWSELRAYLESL